LAARRQFLTKFALSIAGLISVSANAAKTSTDEQSKAVLTRLLKIVDQVGIIIPGEGFKSIKLGDSAEKLVQLWGQPKSTNRKGTLSYLLSNKTIIHFLIKKGYIDTIAVVGKTGSLAHVNNGVVFGMTQGQVLAQFSATPDKHKPEVIRYKALGIELGFRTGKLAEIAIFEP